MTTRETPAGKVWADGQQGDYSGGFVHGIRRITLLSEATVADVLATGYINEDQADILHDMWMAGLDEAGDPDTNFDADTILKMKWGDVGKAKHRLPWACLWVISKISLSLSINGRNFQRVQHMHTGYDSDSDAPTNERRGRRRRRRSSTQDQAA